MEALLNNNGTVSSDNTSYNLAAAEGWMAGAAASNAIADLTNNPVTVSHYNEAPKVNTDPDNSSGGAVGYETGFAAGSSSGVAIVDSDFTISDSDDTHIQSAVITLSAGALDGSNESLAIDGAPATVGAITITYTSASQINSGAVTKAEYEAVIKQITYANSSDPGDVTRGDRTLA